MAEQVVISTLQFEVGCLRNLAGAQRVIMAQLDDDKNCGRSCFQVGEPVYVRVYSNVDYDKYLTKGFFVKAGTAYEEIEEVIIFNNFVANTSKPIYSGFKLGWLGVSLGSYDYESGGTQIVVEGGNFDTGCTDQSGDIGGFTDYGSQAIDGPGGTKIFYGRGANIIVPTGSTLAGNTVGGIVQISKRDVDNPYDPDALPFQQNNGPNADLKDFGFGIAKVSYRAAYDSLYAQINDPGEVLALFLHKVEQLQSEDTVVSETVYTTLQFEISEACDVAEDKLVTIKVRDFNTKELLGGAKVYVDGQFVGVTASDGSISIGQTQSGTHSILIEKTGYIPSDKDGLANDKFGV